MAMLTFWHHCSVVLSESNLGRINYRVYELRNTSRGCPSRITVNTMTRRCSTNYYKLIHSFLKLRKSNIVLQSFHSERFDLYCELSLLMFEQMLYNCGDFHPSHPRNHGDDVSFHDNQALVDFNNACAEAKLSGTTSDIEVSYGYTNQLDDKVGFELMLNY